MIRSYHDVLLQDLRVELLAVLVVTGEALLVVGHVHAAVAGTLFTGVTAYVFPQGSAHGGAVQMLYS